MTLGFQEHFLSFLICLTDVILIMMLLMLFYYLMIDLLPLVAFCTKFGFMDLSFGLIFLSPSMGHASSSVVFFFFFFLPWMRFLVTVAGFCLWLLPM